MRIEIVFKDGTKKGWEDTPRPGGSYQKTLKYDNGMVVVTDEYYRTEAFPTDTVQSVKTYPS